MMQAFALQDLSLEAARCMFEFAYLPAQYIHPERLARLRPAALADLKLSVGQVSRAVEQAVGLPEMQGLDLAQTAHRVALLPHEVVRELAWWMGLRCGSAMLRKLVLRQDLETLMPHVSEAQWSWVFSPLSRPLPQAGTTQQSLQGVSVSQWPEILWNSGWSALVALSLALPRSIGQRLWLKFPSDIPDVFAQVTPAPDAGTVEALVHNVTQAYEAVVPAWNPAWDSQWLSQPARELA
jgi:YOP proteins translocation protein K (YscK)